MKSLFNTFTGLVLKNICEIMSLIFQLYFLYVCFNNKYKAIRKKIFLAILWGLQDLSSQARDWTQAVGSESIES